MINIAAAGKSGFFKAQQIFFFMDQGDPSPFRRARGDGGDDTGQWALKELLFNGTESCCAFRVLVAAGIMLEIQGVGDEAYGPCMRHFVFCPTNEWPA